MATWLRKHPQATLDYLGLIPEFISDIDPRPVRDQIRTNYAHGGGWKPMRQWTMGQDGSIRYPGDPAMPILYETKVRDETVRVYDSGWVAVVQPDGTFEVSRMD